MLTGSKIILRAKKLADAQNDYIWQTDPELTRLDAAPLLTISFAQYLSDYLGDLHYPSLTRRRFAIETLEGRYIGNCSYYGIDKAKGEAEFGIMIGDLDYWDKGYGADTVNTLVNYIFHRENLTRIYLKTLSSNSRAQRCFQKCGFTLCGNLRRDGFNFVVMEIYRRQWEESQADCL